MSCYNFALTFGENVETYHVLPEDFSSSFVTIMPTGKCFAAPPKLCSQHNAARFAQHVLQDVRQLSWLARYPELSPTEHILEDARHEENIKSINMGSVYC